MNKLKMKRMTALIFCIILLFSSVYTEYSVSAVDVFISENNDNYDDLDIPDLDNYGLMVEDDVDDKLVFSEETDLVSLPDKYDPRTNNIITSVKSQKPFGLCWMYAANAMLETFVSKNYGSQFNVSELHGAVFRSKIINKYIDEPGYYVNPYDDAGDINHAAQYFTNWNEPIYSNYKWHSVIDDKLYPKEKFHIIDNINHVSHTLTDEQVIIDDSFEKSDPLFCVTGAKYIPNDETSIKNAINAYGAVYLKINYKKEYTTIDENCDCALYSNTNKILNQPNHAVCVIGWDDNYSKNNFKDGIQPQNDGAWLVKNSYGSSKKNSGYIWISYEDTSISYYKNDFVITGVQKADDSEYMLSHDIFLLCHKKDDPKSKNDLVTNKKVIFVNVFDVKDYTNEYNEINKVMFYLAVKDCSYNIKIAQIENDMPKDISDLAVLASGDFNGEGYMTETLSSPYKFDSDNKCAVFIEVIPNSSSSQVYFPLESDINVDRNIGESYSCIDPVNGNLQWTDEIEEPFQHHGNYCIRPILKKNVDNHFAEISSDVIIDTQKDSEVEYNSDSYLFNIHTSTNVILRENRDYIKSGNKIIFKSSYLQSLKDKYTEIVLEFNNNMTKTIVVNPKAKINSVKVSGKYAVGETLTASLVTDIFKEKYDVEYQWQSSLNGVNWYDISNATENQYTISDNDFLRYIRVIVKSSSKYGNVEYPSNSTSEASQTKCVVIGDTDLDGEVNIDDATTIQKYMASLLDFNNEQEIAAEIDGDGKISINDVTDIQKMLAQ